MNDLTRPSAVLGYANSVAIAAATIYLVNKNSALNTKINDLTDDVDTIRDGIKEKVPMIENSIKGLDQNLRNVATAVNNNLGPIIKRADKNDKKMNKYKAIIEEMGETIEILDHRYNTLVKALLDNKLLENFKMEELPEPAPVKPKKVQRKRRTFDLDTSESESESSEEEKPKSRKNKHKSKKQSRVSEDSDEDDISKVARMASRK
jgi:hypothetical protein